jgi:phage-related holin
MRSYERKAAPGRIRVERLAQLVFALVALVALSGYFFGYGETKVHLDALIVLLCASAIGTLLMQTVMKTDFGAF